MKHYVSKYAVCPFYSQEEGQKIHCEGFSKDNRIQLSFSNREALVQHRLLYCYNIDNYKNCPLYTLINKQYEE